MRHDLLRLGPLAHRLVTDSIHDGILVLDRSERLVDANPAARRILPGRFDELVGRSVTELLPAWDLNASEDARLEMKLPSPVGEVLYEASGVPVRGRRGQATGRVIVLRDISRARSRERNRCLFPVHVAGSKWATGDSHG